MIVVPLIVLIPFASAFIGLAVGWNRLAARRVAVVGAGIALGLAVYAAVAVWAGGPSVEIWGTVPTGWIPITVATRADGLGVTVGVMVTGVAAVQVYSTAYMRPEPRYGSYAALVSLFTSAMLLVVFADDLVVLLVGWEVMGICSALLIGQHWERPKPGLRPSRRSSSPVSAMSACSPGSSSWPTSPVRSRSPPCRSPRWRPRRSRSGSCFCSAESSANPPRCRCTWLPDAMAGPTPVSALIHAATMVAAGVFLVARLDSVFLLSPGALAVLAVVAATTMVLAALAALAQDDYKRVLAWSTSSQLAYMLGALAVGGYTAGLFHLLSHAAFKALLFLGAGVIAHAIGTTMLSGMGGLRRSMPLTYLMSTLGLAALMGLPPLGGFFSKESVLAAAEEAALHAGPLPLGGLVGTAGWTLHRSGDGGLRHPGLAAGLPRPDPICVGHGARPATHAFRAGHARRAHGPACCSRVHAVGRRGDAQPRIGVPAEPAGPSISAGTAALSLALVGVGALSALAEWQRLGGRDPAVSLGPVGPLLADGFGVDRLYEAAIVRPVTALSRLVVAGDRDVVHAYVRGTGSAVRALGRVPQAAQAGRVQSYVTAGLAFVVVLALAGAGAAWW